MMEDGKTVSRNGDKNTAWGYIAGGFGTAAKGVSGAIAWGRRKNKERDQIKAICKAAPGLPDTL